ncbi:MAG: DUF4905 domain-containing protein [Ignavibacteriaceae bacterium]|nr:DUF4905 domain-containing protein [Ignavibacteriaceae bacterium]
MAAIKKIYSFTNKKDIWRLVLSPSGYLVIEERDLTSKEVFFNCLTFHDGKVMLKNFQLDEKYWIGIEAVHDNFIFFHKFKKPDMPNHKGVYAFDILNQKIIWQHEDFVFQLAEGNSVYVFQPTFEGRNYFSLNIASGEVIRNLESNYEEINKLRINSMNNDFQKSFLFPQQISAAGNDMAAEDFFTAIDDPNNLVGSLNFLEYNNFNLISYHAKNKNGTLNNYFKVFDSKKQKWILKEIINTNISKMIPDSFFVKDNLLFLLVEKTRLVVYKFLV